MEIVHDVASPMFICDNFTERRLRGNPCAVCFCPTSIYSSSWSELSSLEASCGRGQPNVGHATLTQAEQEAKDHAYAAERDRVMGRSFQQVASEMNLSETCFVYRLPATRIKAVKELIRQKLSEFDQEQAETRRIEEEKMEAELLKASESNDPVALTTAAKNIFSGGLIPSASFLGCLENSMSMGSFSARRSCAKRIQVQWFGLRWFTPTGESSMCGHGTLAAAHCLFEASRLARQDSTKKMVDHVPGEFFLPTKTDVICFVTELGIVTVRRHEAEKFPPYRVRDPMDPAHSIRDSYEVHFPSNDPDVTVMDKVSASFVDQLRAAFNLSGADVKVEDVCLSRKMNTYLVRLGNVQSVLAASPNEVALREVFRSEAFRAAQKAHPGLLPDPRAVILTAENNPDKPGYLKDGERGADGRVISRFFEPWQGVLEDPVSGSAHTIIAPYWLRTLNKSYAVGDKIVCYQASSRGGYVPCIIIGKQADRVALMGSSVTTMRGTIMYELMEDA